MSVLALLLGAAFAHADPDSLAQGYGFSPQDYSVVDGVEALGLRIHAGIELEPQSARHQQVQDWFEQNAAQHGYPCLSQATHAIFEITADEERENLWPQRIPADWTQQPWADYGVNNGDYGVENGYVHVVRLTSAKATRMAAFFYPDDHAMHVLTCEVQPDKNQLWSKSMILLNTPQAVLVGAVDGVGRLTQCAQDGKSIARRVQAHVGSIITYEPHPRLDLLVTAGWDEQQPTIKLWNASDLSLRWTHPTGRFNVLGVSLSGDGRRVVAQYLDGTLEVLDAADGRLLQRFSTPYHVYVSGQVSPTGRFMIIETKAHGWEVWDLNRGRRVVQEQNDKAWWHFSNDDHRLSVMQVSGETRVFDTSDWSVKTGSKRTPPSLSVPGTWVNTFEMNDRDVRLLFRSNVDEYRRHFQLLQWDPVDGTLRELENRLVSTPDGLAIDGQGALRPYTPCDWKSGG